MTNPIDFNPARRTAYPNLLAGKVAQANQLLRGHGPQGLQNWEAFRTAANTFSESSRIQFLSYDPAEYETIKSFAGISKDTFRKLGLNKWDFLCFMGFSKLCNLFKINGEIENISLKAQELALTGQNDMAQALLNVASTFKEKIINPHVRRVDMFPANTEKFRQLSKINWAENVFLSFEHPNYIWISTTPLPDRFCPNSTKHGKWVVNSRDIEETFGYAKLLLPSFSAGELGTLKFELGTRGNGISSLIVYCHDGDPAVKDLISNKIGRRPFWVYDLFCYEADAIKMLVPMLASQYGSRREMSPKLVSNLRDANFCRERGISDIQSEILWRLMHPDTPEYQNPDTDYNHVIDGYFKSISDQDAEEFGSQSVPVDELMRMFLPIMLAQENIEIVRQVLTGQRQTFERLYSPR